MSTLPLRDIRHSIPSPTTSYSPIASKDTLLKLLELAILTPQGPQSHYSNQYDTNGDPTEEGLTSDICLADRW